MDDFLTKATGFVSGVGWVTIVVIILAFALLVANAAYLGKINRSLKSDPAAGLSLNVSKGTLNTFYALDIILAIILGIFVLVWIFVLVRAKSAVQKAERVVRNSGAVFGNPQHVFTGPNSSSALLVSSVDDQKYPLQSPPVSITQLHQN